MRSPKKPTRDRRAKPRVRPRQPQRSLNRIKTDVANDTVAAENRRKPVRRLKAASKISARIALPLNHGLDAHVSAVSAARFRRVCVLARQHRIPSLAAAALLIALPSVVLLRNLESARDAARVDTGDAIIAVSSGPSVQPAEPTASADRDEPVSGDRVANHPVTSDAVTSDVAASDPVLTSEATQPPVLPEAIAPVVPSDPVRYSSADLQGMIADIATTVRARPDPAPELSAQASSSSPPQSSRQQDRQSAVRQGNPAEAAAAPIYNGSALIAEARRYLGTNPTKRATLWCGAFLDMVLRRTGHRGGGNLALGYTKYGKRIHGPKVGAIVVLRRNGGGHVGIVTGIDNSGNPIVISGNHNRRVAIATYPRSRVVAYVVP